MVTAIRRLLMLVLWVVGAGLFWADAAAEFHLTYPLKAPASALMELSVSVRPEMLSRRPRVLFTRADVRAGWRPRRGYGKDELEYCTELAARLRRVPPTARGSGWEALYEAAGMYWTTEDPDLARAAIDWMLATTEFPTWSAGGWRDNYDLAAAYLLTAVGIGYDSFHPVMTEPERERIRAKLMLQAGVVADHHRLTAGTHRAFDYDQNHYYLPVAAMGLVAFALYDEEPAARQWADEARRFMDRVMAFYTVDGFFFEGIQYWSWTYRYIERYVYALERMTGETLLWEGAENLKYYLAHLSLSGPGRYSAFFFGDTGPKHVSLGGRITHYHDRPVYVNFGALAFLAPRLGDAAMLGVPRHYRPGSLIGLAGPLAADVAVVPIDSLPSRHYFADHEVVAWRTDWGPDALCLAFKCGPPEGHRFLQRFRNYTDAYFNFGHAHPDANSLQLDVGGELLLCGPGYTRSRLAAEENTLLVDGRGQRNEGQVHMWRALGDLPAVPYEDYDQLRMVAVHLAGAGAYACGDSTSVCYPEDRMQAVRRHVFATAGPDGAHGHVLLFDEVVSDIPHIYTMMLHTVRDMERVDERRWLAKGREMGLRIDALGDGPLHDEVAPTVVAPFGAKATRPYEGDDQRDWRATHVAVSNAMPAAQWRFLTSLLPVSLSSAMPETAVEPLPQGVILRYPDGSEEYKFIASADPWERGGRRGEARATRWLTRPDGSSELVLLGARAYADDRIELTAEIAVELSVARSADGRWTGELVLPRTGSVRLTLDGRDAIAGRRAAGSHTVRR